LGAVVGEANGNGLAGAAVGANVNANNRQLHPTEYQIAKDYAKLVAKKLGITEEEAEGRIVRQLQRNMDGATAQQDGERRDEPIISILGCGVLKCDAKKTDPNYWNPTYNAEYIKPNQSSYDKGKARSTAGMTPQQIEERNNRAGAPIAKGGAVLLGGYVLLPAAAAVGTELIAFARNPVVYCAANPASCVGAADVAAGTAAGVPVTGVPVPHTVPNTGKVGVNTTAPASQLVDGGGLAAHEAAGGHLLLRHVGQSESALAARLAAEPRIPAASTFLTRAEAEAGVATVLDVQATQLSTWVASGARGQLVLNAPFNGGLVLQRGASAPTSGTGVTVVLRGTGDGN
jgi:hypothetical protein